MLKVLDKNCAILVGRDEEVKKGEGDGNKGKGGKKELNFQLSNFFASLLKNGKILLSFSSQKIFEKISKILLK